MKETTGTGRERWKGVTEGGIRRKNRNTANLAAKKAIRTRLKWNTTN
jgi:hypothetical protein